jgi:hypothetical protein
MEARLADDLREDAVPEEIVVLPPGVDGRVIERSGEELLRRALVDAAFVLAQRDERIAARISAAQRVTTSSVISRKSRAFRG